MIILSFFLITKAEHEENLEHRDMWSEEKDSTQLPLQRQALLGFALQNQKSKANVQEKNPTIFKTVTDTNLLEGFHKGLQNCFTAYMNDKCPQL